jgi:hypothetical protein
MMPVKNPPVTEKSRNPAQGNGAIWGHFGFMAERPAVSDVCSFEVQASLSRIASKLAVMLFGEGDQR